MKFTELIRQIYCEPSIIEAGAHASIRRLIESRILSPHASRAPAQNMCGEDVEVKQMIVSNGVAIIPVDGAIGSGLSPIERGSGAVDVDDIRGDIDEAEASDQVTSILFDFDSPGGMVNGTPELARRIQAIQKPKVAFTRGQIASGAYWLACATDAIFATESADIGSIGVYVPFIDESKAFEMAGLKTELIKAGIFKGAGFPGTSLSDEQRVQLQNRVDSIYAMFTDHVRKHRGAVTDETMQGQTFMSGEAAERGLIDAIVDSKLDVLRFLE